MSTRSLAAICVAFFLAGCATADLPGIGIPGKRQILVRDGLLYKRSTAFTLRAFTVPDLAMQNASDDAFLAIVHRVAEVGGESLCYDLPPLEGPGGLLDPATPKRLDAVMYAIHDRWMNSICRVFGDSEPQDAAYRTRKIDVLAEQYKEAYNAVYWIDGPDAGALAKRLDEKAPRLVTAAREGADVSVVDSWADFAKAPKPALVLDAMPDALRPQEHFILRGPVEQWEAYSETYARLTGEKPWEPDNSSLTEAERADGWIALFDGHSLDGWVIMSDGPSSFEVRDGAVVWIRHNRGSLRTVRRFGNFVLKLEYKIGERGNSGLWLRAPRAARSSRIGMEFQINGDYGQEPNQNSTGSVYDVLAPRVNASRPSGEWNAIEIEMNGPKAKAMLNGELLWEIDFDASPELRPRLRSGFIGLQDHGNPVSFRNIRIKPLP